MAVSLRCQQLAAPVGTACCGVNASEMRLSRGTCCCSCILQACVAGSLDWDGELHGPGVCAAQVKWWDVVPAFWLSDFARQA